MNKMTRYQGLLFLACFIPFYAHATLYDPIIIENNTNMDASASSVVFNNACSFSWGEERGVIKAHGFMKLKASLVNMFCLDNTCDAQIHMSKNCSGSIIGTAIVSSNGGIISLENYGVDGYVLRKIDNYHAVIEGGPIGLMKLLF